MPRPISIYSRDVLVAIFIVGYAAIAFEHTLRLNKAASALLTGVLCWTAYVLAGDHVTITGELLGHLAEIAQIVLFLLGAMTIVELIDAHDGFTLITSRIATRSRRKLLVIISILSFFLSAVLDNLTASIVMMSLVRKLVPDEVDRRYYGGLVIIGANAGGAWSPIGDVTTTMLWIGHQITPSAVVVHVIVPALVSIVVPALWLSRKLKGDLGPAPVPSASASMRTASSERERKIVLVAGALVLLGVPMFKAWTHLPPFMGMLLGLGIIWTLTEIIHKRLNDEARDHLSVAAALQRVDSQSILFFVGILLAISALQSDGHLSSLAHHLNDSIGNVDLITMAIGLSSSVIDNVPLVAAAQGMYTLATFPTDHTFWLFLAFCAGTGGSILIIGSAAGIAVMGIQRITFGWYVRHMSFAALLGYVAGALVYLALASAF